MKRFLLSDLHIGHPEAQYHVIEEVIGYIRQNARPGDEIWGLGDWFHMYEMGFEYCLRHPMTRRFRELASNVPTRLVPGNHDFELGRYRDNPGLGNPISPVTLITPFASRGIWYCHGHEYDPAVQFLPRPLMWAWNHLTRRSTPGNLRREFLHERYLMMVSLVHTRALLDLEKKTSNGQRQYHGIVLGHTHFPMHQVSPELPFLLNDGDMRHSSTFTIEDEDEFRQMTWDRKFSRWRTIIVPRP